MFLYKVLEHIVFSYEYIYNNFIIPVLNTIFFVPGGGTMKLNNPYSQILINNINGENWRFYTLDNILFLYY